MDVDKGSSSISPRGKGSYENALSPRGNGPHAASIDFGNPALSLSPRGKGLYENASWSPLRGKGPRAGSIDFENPALSPSPSPRARSASLGATIDLDNLSPRARVNPVGATIDLDNLSPRARVYVGAPSPPTVAPDTSTRGPRGDAVATSAAAIGATNATVVEVEPPTGIGDTPKGGLTSRPPDPPAVFSPGQPPVGPLDLSAVSRHLPPAASSAQESFLTTGEHTTSIPSIATTPTTYSASTTTPASTTPTITPAPFTATSLAPTTTGTTNLSQPPSPRAPSRMYSPRACVSSRRPASDDYSDEQWFSLQATRSSLPSPNAQIRHQRVDLDLNDGRTSALHATHARGKAQAQTHQAAAPLNLQQNAPRVLTWGPAQTHEVNAPLTTLMEPLSLQPNAPRVLTWGPAQPHQAAAPLTTLMEPLSIQPNAPRVLTWGPAPQPDAPLESLVGPLHFQPNAPRVLTWGPAPQPDAPLESLMEPLSIQPNAPRVLTWGPAQAQENVRGAAQPHEVAAPPTTTATFATPAMEPLGLEGALHHLHYH